MLGVNKGTVELVSHSKQWGELFYKEKEILEEIIGEHIVEIENFGSTSINNIAAKPIIDILIGVKSLEEVESFNWKKLQEVDVYRTRAKVDGKVVLAKFSNLQTLTKTHYYHVVVHQGEWWKAHTFFRDYLNEHPVTAKQYESIKMKLAVEYAHEERTYTNKKKAFVDEVLSYRNI